MNKEIVAAGLSMALALSACGEQHANSGQTSSTDKQLLAPYQQEVDKVIHHERGRLGGSFTGIEPDRLISLGGLMVSASGEAVSAVEAVSENNSDPHNLGKARLYATVQGKMVEFAERFPKLSLSVFDRKTGRRAGHKTATLNVARYGSVLVLAKAGDFTTSSGNGTPQRPAAITFRPTEIKPLTKTVTFVEPNGSDYADAAAVGVEACQARLDVRAQEERFRIPLQEVVCNSLGFAYVTALGGYSYSKYTGVEDANTNLMATKDGKITLPTFVLSRAAYDQVKAGETPTSLAGGRLSRQGGLVHFG